MERKELGWDEGGVFRQRVQFFRGRGMEFSGQCIKGIVIGFRVVGEVSEEQMKWFFFGSYDEDFGNCVKSKGRFNVFKKEWFDQDSI